jgi:uncharacterized membrane protein
MQLSLEKQRLIAVGLLLLWCIGLIVARVHFATEASPRYVKSGQGLLWNLFLAVVPLLWSMAFQASGARRQPFLMSLFFLLWLLFLPNAPYILTDLIHLAPLPGVPLWYVLAMLLSCAGTGTLLGYLSLLNVHFVIAEKFGKIAGWSVAITTLILCGFGIYLGRFLRWNSWDAFTNPLSLGKTIFEQFINAGPHPHPLPVTFIFGTGLILGYLALRAIALPRT